MACAMKARVASSANRKWLIALAFALMATALALIVSLNRPSQTVEFLVAKQDLPSGSLLSAAQFKPTSVALGTATGLYLQRLPNNVRLRLPIRAGELLSASALGRADERFSVVLSPSEPLSAAIGVGSTIDVWFVPKTSTAALPSQPVRVASGLEVRARNNLDSAFGGGGATLSTLEVAAFETDLPALMLASADGGFISVISSE